MSEELLAKVASEVVVCTKCDLWKSRRKAVPGEGDSRAKIILVGEGPGESEDREGKPFVGAAGGFLEALLNGIGLDRKSVFITNIVKCRPPKNREPRPIEVETCTSYLERQINIIKPDFIITLGKHSAAYVFQSRGIPFSTITEAHGKLVQPENGRRTSIFSTFHPAATLYNMKYKTELKEDFELLRRELKHRKLV